MVEWFKALVLKTSEGATLPWVRIPPSPPLNKNLNHTVFVASDTDSDAGEERTSLCRPGSIFIEMSGKLEYDSTKSVANKEVRRSSRVLQFSGRMRSNMRFMIKFKADQVLRLPLAYQQILQGFIYRTMRDKAFSHFVHEVGYSADGKRSFKLFTYSRLEGSYAIDRQAKKIVFDQGAIEWQVSSVVPQFIQELGQSLLTAETLNLNGQPIRVEEVRYTQPQVKQERCLVRMLSPLTIHRTYEEEGGKKITQFFNPQDAVFSHFIKENLKKKYESYHGRKAEGDFMIQPLQVGRKDKLVTSFKGFMITGWNGRYELSGAPELLDFALKVGVGDRNSQGFGMFEVV